MTPKAKGNLFLFCSLSITKVQTSRKFSDAELAAKLIFFFIGL
jgi:hypothetical protein